MKQFLIFTSLIEGATGLGLIFVPSIVVNLLLKLDLTSPVGMILSLLAGAAILSISLLCWLCRVNILNAVVVRVLLFYNLAVAGILIYGVAKFGFTARALWLVIIFHIIQSIVSVILISKKKFR